MEEKKAVDVKETKVAETEDVISEAEQGLEKEETQLVPESSGDEVSEEDEIQKAIALSLECASLLA